MKGQAAVEYLTTYGWAILALVIVFAALFSSGVLNPNVLITQQCSFGTNLQCSAVLVDSGSSTTFGMTLYNGFPYKVKIDKVSIEAQDNGLSVTGLQGGFELDSGQNITLSGTLSGAQLPVNTAKTLWGNITYVSCAPELGGCTNNEHVITGHITSKVLKAG